MAKIYDAKQCDACGHLFRDDGLDGMLFVLEGDPSYPSIAKQKWLFEDVCPSCRHLFKQALEDVMPQFAKDLRDKDFREVQLPTEPPESPLPSPVPKPTNEDEEPL